MKDDNVLYRERINTALVKSTNKTLFNAKQICKWNWSIGVILDPDEVSFTAGYVGMMRSLNDMNKC